MGYNERFPQSLYTSWTLVEGGKERGAFMIPSNEKVVATTWILMLASLAALLTPISQTQLENPVDVAITDITDVDGVLICINGASGTNVPINITAARLDSGPDPATVFANISLNRMNVETSENVTIFNFTIVLGPGDQFFYKYLWNETVETLSEGSYDIYGFIDLVPDSVYDINMTNNIMFAGRVTVFVVKEDVVGDGEVNILDIMHMTGLYGLTGSPGWIMEDLMPDGIIDLFDMFMVYRLMGWSVGNPIPPKPVPWNLNVSTYRGNYTVIVFSDYIVYSDYSFNKTLKQLNFNVTSNIDAFCNVSIPKGLMSGAFTVYLDDVLTPSIITWNSTHYCVYFTSTELSHKIKIVSEYAVQIIGDLNHDGAVDIFDAILLANHFGESDP